MGLAPGAPACSASVDQVVLATIRGSWRRNEVKSPERIDHARFERREIEGWPPGKPGREEEDVVGDVLRK